MLACGFQIYNSGTMQVRALKRGSES
jgi:hypothetical protein